MTQQSSASKTIALLKEDIRREMKEKRGKIPPKKRKAFSRAVALNFVSNVPLKKGDIVAGYRALPGEIDISLLMEIVSEQGYVCCLPAVNKNDKLLKFRRYKKGDVLIENKEYKVEEPLESAEEVKPNIIITPLLAFDEEGYRLGFGGGFYDRTLSKLDESSNIMAVGVAYTFQKIKLLPREKHDFRLDFVVTEESVEITRKN